MLPSCGTTQRLGTALRNQIIDLTVGYIEPGPKYLEDGPKGPGLYRTSGNSGTFTVELFTPW